MGHYGARRLIFVVPLLAACAQQVTPPGAQSSQSIVAPVVGNDECNVLISSAGWAGCAFPVGPAMDSCCPPGYSIACPFGCCPPGTLFCCSGGFDQFGHCLGGDCVDVTNDNQNCYSCGNVCDPSALCVHGSCQTCVATSGTTFCAGSCTDLTTDVRNCGACGTACMGGQVCSSGTCTCPPPTSLCSGHCVALSGDPNNCGACGHACASGQVCSAGACVCVGGTTACGGTCVHLDTDVHNCGACGNDCGAHASCTSGACHCDSGFVLCTDPMAAPHCVDFLTDDHHCGGCGVECAMGVEHCDHGACTCFAFDYCNGHCVDTQADPTNCGGCATVCTPPRIDCSSGACSCPMGSVTCGGDCAYVAADRYHCGGCSTSCAASQDCVGGACACRPGWTPCSGTSSFPGGGHRTNFCCEPGQMCISAAGGRFGFCSGRNPNRLCAVVPRHCCTVGTQPCVTDGGIFTCCGGTEVCTPAGCLDEPSGVASCPPNPQSTCDELQFLVDTANQGLCHDGCFVPSLCLGSSVPGTCCGPENICIYEAPTGITAACCNRGDYCDPTGAYGTPGCHR